LSGEPSLTEIHGFTRWSEETVSEEKEQPVLDEQMLGKLLEAAYVLQEHNRAMQKLGLNLELQRDRLNERAPSAPAANPPILKTSPQPPPAAQDDYTFTLAQIVETQRLIQVRRLGLDEAVALVADRVASITRASGAGIGILDRKRVLYRGGVGELALPIGTEVAMEKALCVACIRTGQVIRCVDVNPEFLLDAEECHRRGIASIIAVPIYHDGGIAGGLEVYYPNTQGFTEQDVHSCQLMAGLVTEALARDEELNSKKSLAAERAVMVETVEKLKANPPAPAKPAAKRAAPKKASPRSVSAALTFVCRNCGHELVEEEKFCGKCGTRGAESARNVRPGKPAAAWRMDEGVADAEPANRSAMAAGAHGNSTSTPPEQASIKFSESGIEEFLTPLTATREDAIAGAGSTSAETAGIEVHTEAGESAELIGGEPNAERDPSTETALTTTSHAVAWTSAANAREFLEQLAASDHPGSLARFWKARRADVYLAVAVIVMIVVIRWGIWSNHPVAATGAVTAPATAASGHHNPDPEAGLSFFDKILVSLGLAEAPPAPEYKGNPDTQVWVDVHTALYYCPGADLYGKTAKGKFATQKEAQLDQFEPAYRKTCD
jgi:putative methionine-R-sulfoxide reductase with GAF domain